MILNMIVFSRKRANQIRTLKENRQEEKAYGVKNAFYAFREINRFVKFLNSVSTSK